MPLFEACYLIEPENYGQKRPCPSKMVWSFPEDLAALRNKSPGLCDVKVLDQFCYFDYDEYRGRRSQQQAVVGSHSLAQSAATFNNGVDANGRKILAGQSEMCYFNLDKEYYGIALRCLTPPQRSAMNPFRCMKYNLLKRPRSCYVIISRYASPDLYPKTFEKLRNSLYYIHGLDLTRTGAMQGEDRVWEYLQHLHTPNPQYQAALTKPQQQHNNNNTCAPLLPLLEVLGASKFVALMSALLTERRVLVVGDDSETLCRAVCACR